MKNALLIIDVQNGFISENTETLPIKIRAFIKSHNFDFILFFKFLNKENSNWVKILNWRGMFTQDEIEIAKELKEFSKGNNTFEKEAAFSIFSSNEFLSFLEQNKIEKLFMCGLDTHACIFMSAMDAFEKGFDVKVIEDLCDASHGVEYHDIAIKMLKSNLGKNVVIKSENLI